MFLFEINNLTNPTKPSTSLALLGALVNTIYTLQTGAKQDPLNGYDLIVGIGVVRGWGRDMMNKKIFLFLSSFLPGKYMLRVSQYSRPIKTF